MKRRIIEIDEALCNGCELCVSACHEHAIQMVGGKARLVSDIYCDGLGDCLPNCPTGAITMIEREADEYSQDAVDQRIEALNAEPNSKGQGQHKEELPCGCPGTMSKRLDPKAMHQGVKLAPQVPKASLQSVAATPGPQTSQLSNWPVQLKLVNPAADYLKGAHLLVAADCTPFAYANFHQEFIQGRICLIGCPKLDDNQYYIEKLTEIFGKNAPASITVVRMEVPCCGGIVTAVKQAMLQSGMIVPYNEVTITLEGNQR